MLRQPCGRCWFTGLSIFSLLVCCALAACRGNGAPAGPDEPPAETVLREITAEVGLEQDAIPWPDGTFFIPEITGPGVALFDYDNDGDLDLLHSRVPPPGRPKEPAPNRMYRYDPTGVFVDVTAASGLGDAGFGQGIAIGDVDNDGDQDVYFANYGRDSFYRNDGDGTFTEDTDAAGFDGDHWSSSATFCDYDRDGHLDLYVVHYLRVDYGSGCRTSSGVEDYCGPGSFDGQPDTLYRNNGDGTFRDVTDAAGIRTTQGGKQAKGLGVVCLDLTGDAWPDIYVANDGEANQFWVGKPDGTFADQSVMRGVAVNRHGKPEASMGLVVGDVNRDGYLDLLSTHLTAENNTLYLGGKILFRDRTVESGMPEHDLSYTGFGCGLFDLEHDGDLDLAVANGNVALEGPPPAGGFWKRYAQQNLLFRNDGTGRFVNASAEAGRFASRVEISRGLALGDLDADGDLDLVVSNTDNSLRVYRNEAPPPGSHWLLVRALTGSRDALGASVTVVTGGRRLIAPVLANSSYQSAGDPRVHFGLGATDAVDHVELLWPDGQRERFAVAGVDREIEVRQGSGESL
jgi:hypothetical protein